LKTHRLPRYFNLHIAIAVNCDDTTSFTSSLQRKGDIMSRRSTVPHSKKQHYLIGFGSKLDQLKRGATAF
jgi:hypothetical protein